MNKLIYFILVPVLFSSCKGEDVYFEENKAIDGNSWHKDESVSFEFDVEDTVSLYNFYFNVRTSTDYEWSNLYLFVSLETPSTKIGTDTVELPLAAPSGEWYGTNSGSIVTNTVKFIDRLKFNELGTHKFTFNQAMRVDDLPEIMDVGIKMKQVE